MRHKPITSLLLTGILGASTAVRALAAPPQAVAGTVVIDDSPVTLAQSMQPDATIEDLFFFDGDTGWAVGDRGVIWHTKNAGQSWQLQPSGVECRLRSVSFVDRLHGWAAGMTFEPFTHGTRGVVLKTVDGGVTWQQIPQTTLPGIARIKFFDLQHGIGAGAGTAAEPSGVYATQDGGRTWEPVPANGQGVWLAADFIDANNGAVAGPGGQFAALTRRRLVHGTAAPALTRSYRAMRLTPPARGWLVGDGGLVMTTHDLGNSWQTPPGNLPPIASQHFDFRALASLGTHVWAAGSPGTRVFHSPDDGHTWETFDTGQHTPIQSLCFVNENIGWAAGALGRILATHDGGRTWQVQRQGGDRAAVLAVFARDNHVPLEVLAKYSAEEGYLTAVELIHSTGDSLESARAADALSCVGATSTQLAWRFPLPLNGEDLTPEQLLAELNRANDGRALQRLEEHAVRQLRMWRPEVVVTRHAPSMRDDPLTALVDQLVARSVAAAADPARYPQITTDAGLASWQVKRVLGVLPGKTAGDVRITAGEFAPRLGESLADAAAPARELLYRKPTAPPDITDLVWYDRQPADGVGSTDMFADLRIAPGSDARRRLANLPTQDLARLRKLAARRRQMQGLLERAQGSPAWEAQINTLTADLDAASSGELLYQLAEGYRAEGKLDLAADTYSALARRWPEHPLVDPAIRWLVQFYASSEAGHRLASRTNRNLRPPGSGRAEIISANGVQQASAILDSSPVVGLSRDDRLRRAAALGQYLEATRPALYGEPSVRFPLVVAQRQLGFANPAKRYFLTLGGRPESDPWRRCGETEEWFANATGEPPPKPLGNCRRIADRPRLDGRFNEPLWSSADHLRMRGDRGEAGNSTPPSSVRFTYDNEFLYLAISCAKLSGREYPADNRPRPRDAGLARQDHVTIQLDTDRDYTTAYELTVDHRGWTHDACWGDATWNPAWYVAATSDEQSWTIEAAIPLAELVAEPPTARHVWAVSIERSVPGGAAEWWAGDGAEAESPDRFGLLIFE